MTWKKRLLLSLQVAHFKSVPVITKSTSNMCIYLHIHIYIYTHMNKDIYAYIHPLFLQVAHFKSVPVITKSSSSTEDELKECKLIIHKYGSKLEQASSFIDSLGIFLILFFFFFFFKKSRY
jgi:hypothetical protein